MKTFIITIYDEGDMDHYSPIGTMEIQAVDQTCASTIGDLLFQNTNNLTIAKEVEP